MKLRKLREEIPTLRLVRNNLKDDIVKINDQIKDADDSEEEDDLVEQIEIQKTRFLEARDKFERKRKEITEAKQLIADLKKRAIDMLQGLAKKEYLTNPDQIFDFPENNKIRHLSKEI